MGEAKRRAAAEAGRRPAGPYRYPSGLTMAEIEEIAAEDPSDREDRLAHGFTSDDWRDYSTLCRNGCGLTYHEVVAGKIRSCEGRVAPEHAACRQNTDREIAAVAIAEGRRRTATSHQWTRGETA